MTINFVGVVPLRHQHRPNRVKIAFTLLFWAKSYFSLMGDFKWDTLHSFSSWACQATRGQSWRYGRKSRTQTWVTLKWCKFGRTAEFFFRPPTLTFGRFAVSWATRVQSISFESPNTGANGLNFKKVWKHL